MSRYSSQEIDEIVDTLRSAKDRGKPAHILFGAGCSKAAGIPLAWEIVAEIHKLYPGRCQLLPEKDRDKYGACMKLLSPNERRDLLAPYLAKASINWAHVAFAQFMNEGFIDRALTVNFDNLLARACGLLSLYPAIYDFASAPTSDVSLIVSPAIVHLHGQGHGVVLLNTEEETKAHSAKIAPVLRQSMDHPLIVIGYSGATDDVLRILREHYPGTEYLYWLSHNDDPDVAVRKVADDHGYFKCVGGVDADRFLIELAQKLRCWPPRICTNPIGHLLAELKPVSDYPTVPGNEVNILSTVRSRLAELEKSEQQREQTTREIGKLLFEGHYEESVKVFEAIPAGLVNDDQKNLAVAALLLAGDSLHDEARKLADDRLAEDFFKQAETKYEAALRLKPDEHAALNNWGNLLYERALRASDVVTAENLFKQAEAKYETALRIKPDEAEPLYNWGNTLDERASRAGDAVTAEDLFKRAEAKYEAALRIMPDKYEALNNWGIALAGRARRASDKVAAEDLLEQAAPKYEAALRIKPDYHEALNNWGNSFYDRGRGASDAVTAEGFFKQAAAKYEAALQINPDKHEALYNWGNTLFQRAQRVSDPAHAEDLFKQAEAKYETALQIKPDNQRALCACGIVMLERAKRASADGPATDLLNAAEVKLKLAEEAGNTDTFNLACVYALLGRADDCRAAVERTEKAGMLPTADHMQRDDDLTSVRELPWFGELIERLKKKST
jgi:Tfp pilus assembly protein PilF